MRTVIIKTDNVQTTTTAECVVTEDFKTLFGNKQCSTKPQTQFYY